MRPRYRREDYLVDPNSMRAIESERGGYLTVDDLMGERDGPFVGWEEIKRFDRDENTGSGYANPTRTTAWT